MKRRISFVAITSLTLAVLSGCSVFKPSQEVAQKPEVDHKNSLLPPNPKPGECYARVVVLPENGDTSSSSAASSKAPLFETVEPQFEWVEERILVKEASEHTEIIPAKYKTITEEIQVTDSADELIRIPAKYETVTEQVLVRPAHTEWKKGTGPISKVDEETGEILCLVEIPAEYKTVTKEVLVAPETVKKVSVPGKTQTITKRVVIEPASSRTVNIPAEYLTVKVRKLVNAGEPRVIGSNSNLQNGNAYLEWRPILCETNTTPDLVKRLQSSLKNKGYNPGVVDGIMGRKTMRAVTAYQRDQKLPTGQLTISTLQSLGVSI
jgi:regulator of extracellular matrix RemA (YlzA/DUF370 family)